MNKELDEKLVKAFPLLYRDRSGDMRGTCMYWGFPGDGWFQLLWDVSEKLERMIKELRDAGVKDEELPRASQVKEKFGTLRFYMSTETDEMSEAIREAEERSSRVCEECGENGKMRDDLIWMLTLCDRCYSICKISKNTMVK